MPRNAAAALPLKAPSNGLSHKELLSRQSPPPLAPLQYLQNQRRGSITDPSLHAAPNAKSFVNYRDPALPTSVHHEPAAKHHPSSSRPSSPYVFGDATSHLPDNSPRIRNLLRSPSLERPNRTQPSSAHAESQAAGNVRQGSLKNNDGDHMKMDIDPSGSSYQQHSAREPPPFDYNMRRHSIAVGQPTRGSHGTKRKMSADRSVFGPVGEEIDPQLVGPGVPSMMMDLEGDGPAPKRRGSAIDTHRIAKLSLNDRRSSVDTRGGQYLSNDRRDSTSSAFLNIGTYNSGFSGGDPPHGRGPSGIATFAWPANPHSPDQSGPPSIQSEGEPVTTTGTHRSFDPAAQMSIMNFSPDRRMSVPDILSSATGPTRVLRSRSRPPSHLNSNTEAGAGSGQDDGGSPSPSSGHKKESNATPYSRSPELRISHKLAERKRRKEMKELFDELRDQLPADRGMKASKWEILSKAIDFVSQLKQSHQEMAREVEMMRHELDAVRQGLPFVPGGPHSVMYGQAPVGVVSGQFAPSPPHPHAPQPSVQPDSPQNLPTSSGPHSGQAPQNVNGTRVEPSPT